VRARLDAWRAWVRGRGPPAHGVCGYVLWSLLPKSRSRISACPSQGVNA
jgi:hypothetical protein